MSLNSSSGGGGDSSEPVPGSGLVSPVILALSLLGVVSNVAALFIFTRQRFRKDFHRLLMILASYDLLVSTYLNKVTRGL